MNEDSELEVFLAIKKTCLIEQTGFLDVIPNTN
jgi:hypothetical protein